MDDSPFDFGRLFWPSKALIFTFGCIVSGTFGSLKTRKVSSDDDLTQSGTSFTWHSLRYVAVHFHATPLIGRSPGPDTLLPTPASARDRLLQLQLNNTAVSRHMRNHASGPRARAAKGTKAERYLLPSRHSAQPKQPRDWNAYQLQVCL